MKISVSLGDDDLTFIDDYAREAGIPSRSAVLQHAVELLRTSELGSAYADAWAEWDVAYPDAWEVTVADGLVTATST